MLRAIVVGGKACGEERKRLVILKSAFPESPDSTRTEFDLILQALAPPISFDLYCNTASAHCKI